MMRFAAAAAAAFFVFLAALGACYGATDSQDMAAIRSMMSQWQNLPSSWGSSGDPCGTPWDGVTCNDSRVVQLKLTTLGIQGTLSGDIGQLTELQVLDLSFNSKLGGPLTANIGNLFQLTTLILAGCSFTGPIPQGLGNLPLLSFLALNSNQFSGTIPASLGNLANLYWLDIGDNQVSGTLPVSDDANTGLDKLASIKHFHFDGNQLSGVIPSKLFSSQTKLIHILFNRNDFSGEIPDTICLVKSLEALRLDGNNFVGSVPTNINNLTGLSELSLANNKLTGPFPNLTGMNNLNYLDLSNNTFDTSLAPPWLSTLQALTTLFIQSGPLSGPVPEALFGFPQLQQVMLNDNKFNGTLDMGDSISRQLQIVNLEYNDISGYTLNSNYNMTLSLIGNPVCTNKDISNIIYCSSQQQLPVPYSTSLAKCGSASCPADQSLSPLNCNCAYPYIGIMVFRAPTFRDVTNSTTFEQLESSISTGLALPAGSVYLHDPIFTSDQNLQVQVEVFPSTGTHFNISGVLRIGNALSNQSIQTPSVFGPFYFIASPYPFPETRSGSALGKAVIAAIAVGCIVLLIGLIVVGFYAFRQKRRAEKAVELSKPFMSWTMGGKETHGAPQLKGARLFSFDELKKSTNGFSEDNEIGAGGYGKVYKGNLVNGQKVAIKRAQEGSMQGGLEFKTEVELLSRVHHRNLVGLVGFCFEQVEQMLVYEFIPNGTLRERLSEKSDLKLDWIQRLKVALGSARGLAYLHELANPPIIHRDVKSTNILLDENLNAKVADFGLSKLVSDTEKGHVSTQVKGTLGYLDPEYYMSQQLTEKSDVYSFGVVMLELVSAKLPIEKGRYIVREVRLAMDKRDDLYFGLEGVMDPYLKRYGRIASFRRFVELAMQCVEESAPERPTMNEVVKEIEMLLQSEGAELASSSGTDFARERAKGGSPKHPYMEDNLRNNNGHNNGSSDAFKYSGGYSLSTKIEPK